MGRQYVRLTQETVYGTYASMGTAIDLFLPSGNAQTIRPGPKKWQIADAGVGNRLIRSNVGWTGVDGSITTFLFPSQTAQLMLLATTFVSGACYDLNSFTVDHLIVLDSGCLFLYRRYLGCKIAKLALQSDMSDQGCLWSAKIDVIGATPATITSSDFATPALSVYPTDDPYLFFQSAGLLSIGTTRTNYQSLGIDIDNTMKPFRDESRFASAVQWFGRRIMLNAKLRFKANTDRATYESGAKQAVSLALDNLTTTTTFNFGGQVEITSLSDDLPIDDFFTQSLSMTSLMDPAQSPPTDLIVTVAADS